MPRSSFPKSSQDSGLAPPPPPPPRVSFLSQLILGVRPVILRVKSQLCCFLVGARARVQAPTLRARVQAERTTLCDDCRTSQIWHRRSGTHYAAGWIPRVGENFDF